MCIHSPLTVGIKITIILTTIITIDHNHNHSRNHYAKPRITSHSEPFTTILCELSLPEGWPFENQHLINLIGSPVSPWAHFRGLRWNGPSIRNLIPRGGGPENCGSWTVGWSTVTVDGWLMGGGRVVGGWLVNGDSWWWDLSRRLTENCWVNQPPDSWWVPHDGSAPSAPA